MCQRLDPQKAACYPSLCWCILDHIGKFVHARYPWQLSAAGSRCWLALWGWDRCSEWKNSRFSRGGGDLTCIKAHQGINVAKRQQKHMNIWISLNITHIKNAWHTESEWNRIPPMTYEILNRRHNVHIICTLFCGLNDWESAILDLAGLP